MRKQHPLSTKNNISVNDLLSYPHIKISGGADKDSTVDQQLGLLDLHRKIYLQVPFFTAAVSRLIQTDALMVVPLHITINLSKFWPITHKNLPFDVDINKYWVIWHPKFDNDVSHKWVREQIVHSMQDSENSIHLS